MKDNVARDIMTTEVIVATESTTIEDAIKLLVTHRITGLPVVNGKGKLIGVVSEYDIIKSLNLKGIRTEVDRAWLRRTIPLTPEGSVVAVEDGEALEKIIERFITTKNRRLPVVDRAGKLVGVITRRDIMRLLFFRSRLP